MSLKTGTGTLSGTTPRTTDGSGIATFADLSINLAGAKTLEFAASGITVDSASFTINPAAIDQYWVSNIDLPVEAEVAGIPFSVTIQAQDYYDNNITSDSDAAEMVDVSLGLPDAGANWTSPVVTSSGTATITDMTMTVAQDGQSLIFTEGTSSAIGTSNAFDVES